MKYQQVQVDHGLNVVKICDYPTDINWKQLYSEAPRDRRFLDFLAEYDEDMFRTVQGWHRSHGGIEEVAKSLSLFNKLKKNYNTISEENQHNLHLAKQDVLDMFCDLPEKARIRPLHHWNPPNSNSGFPHFVPRKEIIDDIIDEARQLSYHVRKGFSDFKSIITPPVMPFVKAVPTPIEKHSTRGVWCFPAIISCLESTYAADLYHVLLKYCREKDYPIAIGQGAFNKVRHFLSNTPVKGSVCGTDYVKGDANQPAWKIRIAFDILSTFVDWTRFDGRLLSEEEKEENHRQWSYLVWYFINTPFVFNDVLYRKKAGIPSGSTFTMLVWLMINLLDKCFLARCIEGRKLRRQDALAGGDDGAVHYFRQDITVDEITTAALGIGTLFHGEPKTRLRTWDKRFEVQMLSTLYEHSFELGKVTEDLVSRIAYPSTWSPSREDSVARALSIALSIARTNEYVTKLARAYLCSRPLNLKATFRMDDSLRKYFAYVMRNAPSRELADPGATLYDLVRSFSDERKWFIIACNL